LNTVIHWSGRALWLEKKINRFIRNVKDDDLPFIYFTRLYYETMSNYLSGQLITDSSNDEIVFKYAMSTGRIWATTVYHVYKGIGYVELGMKKEVLKLIDHLYIITSLEHSFSLTQYYRLKMTYFLKFRKMEDLLGEAKKGIEAISKTDHSSILLLGHSILSMAYSLHDNLPKAQEHLTKSKVLAKKLWVKYYASMANLSQVYYDLAKIKRKGNSPSKSEANELLKHTKELIFNSKSVYCNKTEAYRLRAISYFYAQKTNKAAKCLKKSIDFAHYYGSKLEGSRTYFETGKFLSDPNVKSQELDGKTARHYLENAKSMFEEMDLQWDLEEYRTFTSH